MRHLAFSGLLLAAAMSATPAAAQSANMPGLAETVAYIRERCDGVSYSHDELGAVGYSWSFDQRAGTMTSILHEGGRSFASIIPVRFVNFVLFSGTGLILARCPEVHQLSNCPIQNNGQHIRVVEFSCRERDNSVNALKHLQSLLGGPAPASDAFA